MSPNPQHSAAVKQWCYRWRTDDGEEHVQQDEEDDEHEGPEHNGAHDGSHQHQRVVRKVTQKHAHERFVRLCERVVLLQLRPKRRDSNGRIQSRYCHENDAEVEQIAGGDR